MSTTEESKQARELLRSADRVLIGAGAGLSTAAGLGVSGERFERLFAPFIKRYGITDAYSGGFYPFPTPEDKWAWWAQHIWASCLEPGATPLYRALAEWARERECFVITTNVDAQFEFAGFDQKQLFIPQGDYRTIQCAKGCHPGIYRIDDKVAEWRADLGARPDGTLERTRLSDPALVPRCPVCGGPMEMHLRIDSAFVENGDWRAAQERYRRFVEAMPARRTVLLELGVGWNTPVWIRYPFEQIAQTLGPNQAPLVRMNFDPATADTSRIAGAVGLAGDIAALWDEVAI